MKKLISIIAASSILASATVMPTVYADAAFTDLSAGHWAYSSVSQLVSSGTINGYDDGSFLPDATVTRAEFVKMLGKSDVKRDSDFADVAANHWAYDYIIYSGLEGDEANNFNPDVAITRNDVAQLLYKRFASNADAIAPYPVTSSGTSVKAAAWVYNSGLMLGDDMVNLRLQDSLTRAEAAVLIVRAQNLDLSQKRNFTDNFPDEVYEKIYTDSDLFDTPYNANEKITNGEVARAALRLQYRERNPLFAHYNYKTQFEGEYAKEWSIMTSYVMDNGKLSCTSADCGKNATVADALAMLSYCVRSNSFYVPQINAQNNAVYPEINADRQDSSYFKALSYAYNYGISLYADAKINPNNEITKKELACIIMQYDMGIGANIAYRCGYNCTYVPTPLRRDIASYPANAADYTAVLNDIPNEIYETPLSDLKGKAADFTAGAKSIAPVFIAPLTDLCSIAYNKGITVYITFYPTIAGNANKGYVYRVKFEIENAPEGTMLSSIVKLNDGVSDFALSNGSKFYADILTNAYLSGIYLDSANLSVARVIMN